MKTFLLQSLPILILLIMALAIYYMSMRISWAFGFNKIITIICTVVLVVGSFLSMMIIMRANQTSSLAHIISNVTNVFIGIAMITVCVTLIVDAVNLFYKIEPHTFGYTVIILSCIISAYSLYNASNTRVYNIDLEIPNLEKPLNIAHVSDTHFGHYWGERTAQKLANIIKQENVDLVVITGDMFDGRARLNKQVVLPFTKIGVPVIFAEGNHDGYSGSRDVKNLLRDNGIIVLENQLITLEGLQIIGLDYLASDENTVDTFHYSENKNTIKSILPTLNIDKSKASLLMHHNPVGANYAAENGINLYLAGHTHAGQIFPATIIAEIMFDYNKGLYKYNDDMQIYVSQGTGTFGPPMRLGTHSELTILRLKAE